MTLWLVLSWLTAIGAFWISLPFLGSRRAASIPSGAVALAKEQLRELDADLDRSMIEEGEAKAARSEIERRLIAAAKAGDIEVKESGDRAKLLGVAIASGWVVVGSALLYSVVGRPDLPSAPTMARAPMAEPVGPIASSGSQVGGVDEMIAGLAERLADNPEDAEGWRMLGWSYFQTGNYLASVDAYSKAVALDDSDPVIFSVLGEAMVRSGGGEVTDAALDIFHKALALDPMDPRARFFQGMALEQRGNPEGAIRLWAEILETAPTDADWASGLRARIDGLAGEIGFDLTLVNLDPAVQSGVGLLPVSPSPGPTAADVRAAEEMNATDRQAMILGMVEGLAARLEDQPDDVEGWIRLIRSYTVLGDMEAAREALSRARDALGAGNAGLRQIETAAADLGVL